MAWRSPEAGAGSLGNSLGRINQSHARVGYFRQLPVNGPPANLSPVNPGYNSPNEAPYEEGKDFRVVIACEDSSTAPSACEVLEMIEQNLKAEGRLFYQWWNFELLAITSLRDLAAAEATTADMILIDIHDRRELPRMVTDWMNQWLGCRKDRPGALVAVVDSDLKKPSSSRDIILQLKKAAAAGHLDFFASQAMEVGRDAGVARKVGEVVWQIRHGAQQRRAKRFSGRRAGEVKAGADKTLSTRIAHYL